MMKQDSVLTVPTELFLALYTVQTSDQQAVCTVFICKRNDFSVFFSADLKKNISFHCPGLCIHFVCASAMPLLHFF